MTTARMGFPRTPESQPIMRSVPKIPGNRGKHVFTVDYLKAPTVPRSIRTNQQQTTLAPIASVHGTSNNQCCTPRAIVLATTARRKLMAKPQAIRPIKPSRNTAMMLYGPPGAGKTRLIGVPGSLILHPPTDHVDSIRVKGADEWVIEDWAEMLNALEYMRHDAAKDYKWVWLDSISLWQDTGLDDIWESVIARRPDRAQWTLDKGEYGINMWRLQQWVRTAIAIPNLNIGITAHPAEMLNPLDGEIKMAPWVQGKNMSTKIQGYMKIVAYLEVVPAKDNTSGEPRRVLRTAGTERYEAKDQYDAFPKGRMVDPTLEKIEKAIAAVRQVSPTPDRRAVAKPRPGQRQALKPKPRPGVRRPVRAAA